ncbi:protein croquemort-like isoform X2 [Panulirus ornatus]
MEKLRFMTRCQVVLLVLALLVLVFSVVMLAGCYYALIHSIMQSHMEIREGSEAYEMWKATPVPLLLKLYLFNLTNAEDFKNGQKPILQECGPYVWREYHEKQNVTFHPNNTVTYYQQRWWIWDETLSGNNSQYDTIVTVNTIPVTVAWAVRNHSMYLTAINEVFHLLDERAIINGTVSEIIFTGVEDPLLDWIQREVVADNGTFHFLSPLLGAADGLASYDKFAWFYRRNLSVEYDGLYNMMTGVDTLAKLGDIDWWNYKQETPFFAPPCNRVAGSAGELFPPHLSKNHLIFFSSDLCMSIKLFYKEETRGIDDLPGYRYWGTNHTFTNGSVIPGNECYCVKGTCAPTGLLNAESCRMGAPAFISFPHFLNADPYLLDGVTGLAPDEEKHSFFFDLIPEIGVPLRVAARVQINMKVQPYPGHGMLHLDKIDILGEVPEVFLPMLWFEILAEVTPDMASRLSVVTFLQSRAIYVFWWTLVAVALLTLIVVVGFHCWRTRRGYEVLN